MRRTTSDEEITLDVWSRGIGRIGPRKFKGRTYVVFGAEIVLFPIGVLAAAIGRDRTTILDWERAKLFPAPMWKVPDKRTKRWYSRAQIEAIREIHVEMCHGDYGFAVSRHFELEAFCQRVRKIFRTVDAELVSRTRPATA